MGLIAMLLSDKQRKDDEVRSLVVDGEAVTMENDHVFNALRIGLRKAYIFSEILELTSSVVDLSENGSSYEVAESGVGECCTMLRALISRFSGCKDRSLATVELCGYLERRVVQIAMLIVCRLIQIDDKSPQNRKELFVNADRIIDTALLSVRKTKTIESLQYILYYLKGVVHSKRGEVEDCIRVLLPCYLSECGSTPSPLEGITVVLQYLQDEFVKNGDSSSAIRTATPPKNSEEIYPSLYLLGSSCLHLALNAATQKEPTKDLQSLTLFGHRFWFQLAKRLFQKCADKQAYRSVEALNMMGVCDCLQRRPGSSALQSIQLFKRSIDATIAHYDASENSRLAAIFNAATIYKQAGHIEGYYQMLQFLHQAQQRRGSTDILMRDERYHLPHYPQVLLKVSCLAEPPWRILHLIAKSSSFLSPSKVISHYKTLVSSLPSVMSGTHKMVR